MEGPHGRVVVTEGIVKVDIHTLLGVINWLGYLPLFAHDPSHGSGCFLHLAHSGALDHGLTVGTGANVLDLRDVSNCGLGQYVRSLTLTPTNFSMYC